jgi:hypothetical protein
MRYILVIISLVLICCSQGGSSANYDFSYGYFAKQDKTGKFPFIMNVYNITENSLEISSYNENRKVKNVLGSVSLSWTTTANGLKIGYNEEQAQAVIFYNNQYYFSNGASASLIISGLMKNEVFDNSLFLKSITVDFDGSAEAKSNNGLMKLSSDEITQFSASELVAHEEVVREIIDGMAK